MFGLVLGLTLLLISTPVLVFYGFILVFIGTLTRLLLAISTPGLSWDDDSLSTSRKHII